MIVRHYHVMRHYHERHDGRMSPAGRFWTVYILGVALVVAWVLW